jgi:hypothetical protein
MVPLGSLRVYICRLVVIALLDQPLFADLCFLLNYPLCPSVEHEIYFWVYLLIPISSSSTQSWRVCFNSLHSLCSLEHGLYTDLCLPLSWLSTYLDPWKWNQYFIPKRLSGIKTISCVITQRSAVLIYLNIPSQISPVTDKFLYYQPLVSQDLLIIEASKSHSDASHLLGLLWMSDQPDAQTSSWQYTEPAITAKERPRTHALDRGATGISFIPKQWYQILVPVSRIILCLLSDGTSYFDEGIYCN